jgi:7-keto-8-aminopelargonate synthetase-like enzyme
MYVTPEKVAGSKRLMSKLEKLYAAGQLLRVAVDEAHCVSQVGREGAGAGEWVGQRCARHTATAWLL